MKLFLNLIFFLIRIFVIYKMIFLLYHASFAFEITNELKWWCCFLIFDFWLQQTFGYITPKDSE